MPNASTSSLPEPPTLKPFMQSRRVHAGRPDTQFFWITRDGHPCIAKQMELGHGPQVDGLLKNEREVLRLLNARKAPVCLLVDDPDHPEWLITRFAGFSLHLLGRDNRNGWPPLPLAERVSVWAGFMLRAGALADAGILPLDLADRNLVVPRGPSGHLDLGGAVSIDHAHTVVHSSQLPDGALRRPVWIGASNNLQLAPEVRDCLIRDQQKFLDKLQTEKAPLPGSSQAIEDKAQVTRRIWLAYSEPQDVQRALDSGTIDPDKAIQYAIGHAIHRHLTADDPMTPALAAVVLRLVANDPADRFAKMEHAADALKAALGGKRAFSSKYAYPRESPEALLQPPESPKELLDLADFLSIDNKTLYSTKLSLGEGFTEPVTLRPATKPAMVTLVPTWRRHVLAAVLALAVGWPLGQKLAQIWAA